MCRVIKEEVIIYLGNYRNLLITHSLEAKIAQIIYRSYFFSIA
jgi:hypothetical protein